MNQLGQLVNVENLQAHGYKPYSQGNLKQKFADSYIGSFQKRIDDQEGKKYFINVNQFTFDLPIMNKETYDFSCQFTNRDGKHVNVSLHWEPTMTISYIESFYEEMWQNMKFDYEG